MSSTTTKRSVGNALSRLHNSDGVGGGANVKSIKQSVFYALILITVYWMGYQSNNSGGSGLPPDDRFTKKEGTNDKEDDPQKKPKNQSPHYLEELMYHYGSDKSKDDHSYTDLYQMLFNPIRLDVKHVMEVGVAAGQSIQAWHHYFPSMHEWAIVSGTLAMALLIITILVRYVPIIPIQRTADEQGILKTEKQERS